MVNVIGTEAEAVDLFLELLRLKRRRRYRLRGSCIRLC
ncbi:hypothetical protein B5P46_25205 [Rhizobium leguminosarum]|uniref:Uncharacterized protein n=2 Tax=Rhizobium leguminosarum TaxID=384 RepID=A0A4Q1TLZ2_RHILE|nr:hypothetical protein B5P46_25205 [Rhizobium leguminosarum]